MKYWSQKRVTSILQISILHYPINNNDVFTISFSNNLKLFSNEFLDIFCESKKKLSRMNLIWIWKDLAILDNLIYFISDCIKWPYQKWCYFRVFCLQSYFSNWKDDFLFYSLICWVLGRNQFLEFLHLRMIFLNAGSSPRSRKICRYAIKTKF